VLNSNPKAAALVDIRPSVLDTVKPKSLVITNNRSDYFSGTRCEFVWEERLSLLFRDNKLIINQ